VCGVSECNREALTMRRPWPIKSRCVMKNMAILINIKELEDGLRHRAHICNKNLLSVENNIVVGRDSSVGTATRYGLKTPEFESRWRRNFPHSSRLAMGPTQPSIQWVPGVSRGQSGRGMAMTTHSI
jgi:hypothetical protein